MDPGQVDREWHCWRQCRPGTIPQKLTRGRETALVLVAGRHVPEIIFGHRRTGNMEKESRTKGRRDCGGLQKGGSGLRTNSVQCARHLFSIRVACFRFASLVFSSVCPHLFWTAVYNPRALGARVI